MAGSDHDAQPLVHGYDTVNYDMLWDTLLVDFPPLVDALRKALAELGD